MLSNLCWPFELQPLDSRVASSLSIRIYVDIIIIHTCWVWPSSCNSDQQKEHTNCMNHAGERDHCLKPSTLGARKWARSAQYFFLVTATGDRQDSTYMYHVSHDIVDHVITKTYRVYSGAKASI